MLAASVRIANAQRFETHIVYLDNNGIGTQTVKVKSAKSFTIKKNNRILWATHQIAKGEVTFSAKANSTKKNRSCDFVLIDNSGKPVDTLKVIQTNNALKTTAKKVSNKSKGASTVALKSSSSRSSYGGQCAATTKKGNRCSRKAASGSIYCWQHR